MDSLPLDELVEMPQETLDSSHLSSLSAGLHGSETNEESYSDVPFQQSEAGQPESMAEDSATALLTSAPLTTEEESAMDLCFLSRDEERKEKEKQILRSGKGKDFNFCFFLGLNASLSFFIVTKNLECKTIILLGNFLLVIVRH